MNEKTAGHEHTGLGAELKVLLREPPLLISILAVFLLFAVFIIYPFAKILLVPTAADWMRAITGKEFIQVFGNTIFSSLIATATAIVFGFLFAYGINYTNMPCKRFFQVVALLPTMAPSVVTGLAFIMLFGRRGFITWQLLHLKVDLYGPFGLWVAQTIAFFPLAYITISGVLKSISPNLELAAQNLGARGWYLFRTVTLRLATPGLASAFLLVAINSLADFGNPMLVGGNYHVLATEAYTQVTGAWDLPMGATLSVFLVIPTLIVFFVQRYYLEKNSYVTVTGKPVAGLIRVTAGPVATGLLWAFCMLLCLAILMIIGVVILFAFTTAFGYDYTFTLDYFREGVLQSNVMAHSWVASMATAAITTVLGIALAFLTIRKKFPGRTVMDFLAMLPVSLPGTFIGLAMILAFNDGVLEMTGTLAIIILGGRRTETDRRFFGTGIYKSGGEQLHNIPQDRPSYAEKFAVCQLCVRIHALHEYALDGDLSGIAGMEPGLDQYHESGQSGIPSYGQCNSRGDHAGDLSHLWHRETDFER